MDGRELTLYQRLYATLLGRADTALSQLDSALAVDGALDLAGVLRARQTLADALLSAEEAYLDSTEQD